jgi:hypothetical protein
MASDASRKHWWHKVSVRGIMTAFLIPTVVAALGTLLAVRVEERFGIDRPDAETFLEEYYAHVVKPPHEREQAWQMLTRGFQKNKSNDDINDYHKHWNPYRQVIVSHVEPVEGRRNTFLASLTYESKTGGEESRSLNFELTCASLLERWRSLFKCNQEHLRIRDTF